MDEAREVVAADQSGVLLDDALLRGGVGTEPGRVSARASWDILRGRTGPASRELGASRWGVGPRLSD